MYDLRHFVESDLNRCISAMHQFGEGATSMEELAGRIVRHLYDFAIEPEGGERQCVLVRFYKTCAFKDLDAGLRTFAERVLGRSPESAEMKCLTLLASAGDHPEWNSRARSLGHRAIPLPDEEFLTRLPMIARLVNQFGLDLNAVIHPDPNLLADLEQRTYNAFHVAEAAGSPYIPAQVGFVVPNGIRSVVGFGGMLQEGDLFAVILFARVPVPWETAELMKLLGYKLKDEVQPFTGGNVFAM